MTLGSALGVPLDGFAPRGLAIGAEGEEESWEVERMLLTDLVSDNVDHSTLPHFRKWILIWGGMYSLLSSVLFYPEYIN